MHGRYKKEKKIMILNEKLSFFFIFVFKVESYPP